MPDVPIGGIILWPLAVASIPSGYVLCDGSAGTADLRDRCVPCAGGMTYLVGDSGGSNLWSVPSHTHTAGAVKAAFEDGHGHDWTITFSTETPGVVSAYAGGPTDGPVYDGLAHTHPDWTSTFDGFANTPPVSNSGHEHPMTGTFSAGSASESRLPAIIALYFIQRVS